MARFAIDFDETLFENTEDGGIEVIPGAAEAVRELKSLGHTIIIYSARPGLAFREGGSKGHRAELDFMEEILQGYGIPFDSIFEGEKPVVDVYIDDRALRFEGTWQKTLKDALEIVE